VSPRASRFQADQTRLSGLLLAEFTRLWPELVAEDPPLLGPTVLALLRPYAVASAALAAEFYDAEREVAGARTRFTVPVAEPPPLEQVTATMSWATRELRADEPDQGSAGAALTLARGAVQRLVVDAGRRTLARAVTADDSADGWARVPTGAQTCHFCAMLATRGAVYKSRSSGGSRVSGRFVGEGNFKFHDSCNCTLQPIFRGQRYQPPREVEQWEQLYAEVTAGESGAGKLRAFRQAFNTTT
jgi:hypothetical protein